MTLAGIFAKYYTNILLYYILYTFVIYSFTILISIFVQRSSMKWFYFQESLYKTQIETMNRAARSFTDNSHAQICRSPVPRIHEPKWQETHTFQKKFLKNSPAPMIIIGDSITSGLGRYGCFWRNCLKDAVN